MRLCLSHSHMVQGHHLQVTGQTLCLCLSPSISQPHVQGNHLQVTGETLSVSVSATWCKEITCRLQARLSLSLSLSATWCNITCRLQARLSATWCNITCRLQARLSVSLSLFCDRLVGLVVQAILLVCLYNTVCACVGVSCVGRCIFIYIDMYMFVSVYIYIDMYMFVSVYLYICRYVYVCGYDSFMYANMCTYCICTHFMTVYSAVRIPFVSNCAIQIYYYYHYYYIIY